ncbi:hypothetical protein [Halorussus sp. MSC15.2]|uniref:hypothetical protein n=1 Tax=Halorussus sp. MSC15.2 TaxID=2283638 RepID=UPI0013D58722|nr:hypothetical protein [Halorussus sp. MSC15.2]NEU55474.1 hypothetical protein [Halorussus sp. MSC15.2]
MTEKSRRDILKYTGSSIVAPSLLAQSTSAKTTSDDFRKTPGQHTLPGNIHLVNNSQNTREVTVTINRVTPGKQNPVVDEFKYVIDGQNGKVNKDSASNILVDDTPIKMSTPGIFEVNVETDDGRTESYEFTNPTGRMRENERLNIRLVWGSLRITRQRT